MRNLNFLCRSISQKSQLRTFLPVWYHINRNLGHLLLMQLHFGSGTDICIEYVEHSLAPLYFNTAIFFSGISENLIEIEIKIIFIALFPNLTLLNFKYFR